MKKMKNMSKLGVKTLQVGTFKSKKSLGQKPKFIQNLDCGLIFTIFSLDG